jgi:hypothetical protein
MSKNIPYMANENFTYKPIVHWYFFIIFISVFFRFFILGEENFGKLTTITLALIWIPIIFYSLYISYKDYPLRNYIYDKYNDGEMIFSPKLQWQILFQNDIDDPLLKRAKNNYEKYITFVIKVFFSLPLLMIMINVPWGEVIVDVIRYINTGSFEG